jgi:hypothetical protein
VQERRQREGAAEIGKRIAEKAKQLGISKSRSTVRATSSTAA